MASTDRPTGLAGGPYPEEILLEAYNLEWESIELRLQRLRKSWQQTLLTEKMEEEERQYRRQLRRIRRHAQQQKERKAREQTERLAAEKLRRQHEEILANKRRDAEKQKQLEQERQYEEEVAEKKRKKALKNNGVAKEKTKPKQTIKVQERKVAQPKRIAPTNVTSQVQVEAAEENPPELDGYDSPPRELPADDLLNMLSLDKASDSELDDEPSMVSLILPVSQNSPKRVPSPAKKKKIRMPQKRLAKKGVEPLDFNFTNAEAKRQAKAAKGAARVEEEDCDDDTEPEPMPSPSTLTPKRLKRRKEVAKERKKALSAAASTGTKSLMEAVASTTVAIAKPSKASGISSKQRVNLSATVVNGRKKIADGAAGKSRKGAQNRSKPQPSADEIEVPGGTKSKQGEKMTIKQRLANAEMLARLSKMQDVNTPKVLSKKVKKTKKNDAMSTLAAKRAEFRKVLASDPPPESNGYRREEGIEERDLNISLNSSFSGGQLSDDNNSPDNLRNVTLRKRPREVERDVTPTKKLQFQKITKRLVKSPMPRFLRTPTPLMSPAVAPALATSPNPRRSGRGTSDGMATTTRRTGGGAPHAKKTANANSFGIPAGGTKGGVAGSGGFSMFDAFVNSSNGGGIPRLKTQSRGDMSPTV
ncbi:hypothetical protein PHYBOEH_009493 [Phytophthora boehmeriae]|uniref:Uncharacterized protein n=1 Tax=Phytophthora boehmeriae TaxID=109152 RepID=A0A8T1XD00_9STRA|nr:hypothetical protein PHYBOEH_009493 [Phytophthora boehmeriae]